MPIDQTIRGLALEIDASVDPAPEAQPLLEYRFINAASTQTILARIKGIPRPDGGGQLAFETNAGADTTTQRMLIDDKGRVGIGTGNPEASLDVLGDARFSGPLSVQGVLTASGAAKIGGDLSVTGKVSATSFAGDGGELSNIRPMNDSVGGAELASDPQSLSKVSGGKVIVKGDRVGVGVQSPDGDCILDVGARMKVKQGESASAGIWFAQRGADHSAFVGMADDSRIGFWGHGAGWGLTMSKDDGSVTLAGALSVGGITKINKLQLGSKWLLSGEGDAHGNDEWLRLFNIQGTDYFGGFAAGKLWSIGGVVHGSDRRLKADVSSLDRMVDKLVALRGVRFKWRTGRDGDSYRIGLIAQEVERVLPEVIETGPDGMKGINEAGLVAAIITAIKEQQLELRALRAEFALFRAA
jgi:Chaperone of endosialidase